jgi:hypothetical protein
MSNMEIGKWYVIRSAFNSLKRLFVGRLVEPDYLVSHGLPEDEEFTFDDSTMTWEELD